MKLYNITQMATDIDDGEYSSEIQATSGVTCINGHSITSKPLALSDQAMQHVQQAAALLPLHDRDPFLRSVAGHLADIAKPSDSDVAHAVALILNGRGISTPLYLCDSTPSKQHAGRKAFQDRYSKFSGANKNETS
jgi:hypothetical protein